jgi:spore maturation protein CgeB
VRILYQIPSLETVYAARFIYEGYKEAFIELGHEFNPLTASDNLEKVLDRFYPDILISSLNYYNLKFLDLDLLFKYRQKGLVFFNQIHSWLKHNKQFGGSGLGSNKYFIYLIKAGKAGDVFFHWLEQDDPSMDGFESVTGYKFYTILLAANTKLFYPDYDDKYKSEISYVGSNLKDKIDFFNIHLFPLKSKYQLKIYGSDWAFLDRFLGYIQKSAQYFNIYPLKKIRRLKLSFDDERKVYSSSIISLNIHENHQRRLGCDFNERTFKIIASGGFEICDNVKVLRKYFNQNELVIAEDTKDWFYKIDYFIKNPNQRNQYVEKGMKKVLSEHTYKNRVNQIIDIYNKFKSKRM